MKIVETITEIKNELSKVRKLNKTIGFVPTMGALHEGHLQLVKRSIRESGFTVVSIYVNPTQFNDPNDLNAYPRNLSEDVEKLKSVGCDLLFYPSNEAIYPQGYKLINIDLDDLENVLEGKYRPGHFDGVVTVVSRFFQIIEPNQAYFGEKDYQQLLIVQKVADSVSREIKIVPCPIEREVGGLAMSSRNKRLSDKQKLEAQVLSKVLEQSRSKIKKWSISETENWAIKQLNQNSNLELEYFKIVDQDNLKVVKLQGKEGLRAFVAAMIGGVRLIDNMKL
ncbi:MAG: pantoate--beta-alanine ligase [Crocinitomicaceae bacterium]|nr:pantoate--beta-alanine ligase [Crocinitomicaceae bacterium]